MGILDKFAGGTTRTVKDYDEQYLSVEPDTSQQPVEFEITVAEINGQQDVLDVTDAIYDNTIVIADISGVSTSGSSRTDYTEKLRTAVKEVGGDIAMKGDDEIIITPAGIRIRREKMSR